MTRGSENGDGMVDFGPWECCPGGAQVIGTIRVAIGLGLVCLECGKTTYVGTPPVWGERDDAQ